jgi:hypothetical protein
MSSSPSPPRLHPAHAISVYAEPLASGRRVVVVGDSSLEVGAVLIEAGARTVHVYDPSRERARDNAGIARGVTVRELPAEFEVRDGAFDLAIVPDLATAGDPPALLARLRRLVGPEGAILVAARNPDLVGPGPDTIDYTDLYDMVSLQFEHVRMIGQVPFTGVTLAELGVDDEPEVSVDTRLGPDDKTPHVFLALASQREVTLAPYALVELPTAPAPARADDAGLRAALAEARLKADALTSQLDEARTSGQRASSDAEASRGRRVTELQAHVAAVEARAGEHFVRAERLGQEVAALEGDVTRLRARAVELEEQTSDYKRMRAISEVELMASRAGIAELEERALALANELEAVGNAVAVPAVDAQAIARLAERAELAERAADVIVQLESDLVHAGELHSAELGQLEGQLRQRGQAIKHLEHEIVRRERLVKELVGALEEARAVAHGVHGGHEAHAGDATELTRENHALRAKLDELALHVARQKGETQSQEWKVTELEQRLAMALARSASASPTTPSADPELGPLRAELDALRQAMAQEHEARMRAESGEALTRAQTELARQATLIEQLSRELDAEGPRGRRRPEPLAD